MNNYRKLIAIIFTLKIRTAQVFNELHIQNFKWYKQIKYVHTPGVLFLIWDQFHTKWFQMYCKFLVLRQFHTKYFQMFVIVLMKLSPFFWFDQLFSKQFTEGFNCLAKTDAIIFESFCHLFFRTFPDHQYSQLSSQIA